MSVGSMQLRGPLCTPFTRNLPDTMHHTITFKEPILACGLAKQSSLFADLLRHLDRMCVLFYLNSPSEGPWNNLRRG